MEFKLEPYRRNISEETLLNDLKQVSKQLGKNCVSEIECNANGEYSSTTYRRRFGSWNVALEKAELQTHTWVNVSDESYIQDIKRVAAHLSKRSVTQNEYNDFGKYSADAIRDRFGSWLKALALAGLEKTCNLGITEEEFFSNLEAVWTGLGRQPRMKYMHKPLSLYSADAYKDRFGSWRKALEAFVDFVNRAPSSSLDDSNSKVETLAESKPDKPEQADRGSRYISWRLRFLIMRRDGFKCNKCGRSPATEVGVKLHVDHKEAWSKGGPTNYENLQTLCDVCNIGKSDLADSL